MHLGCKSNPQIVDVCFAIRGRLSAYNGNPSFRIWPIGTQRLLGVVDDQDRLSVPSDIRNRIGFGNDVFADYVVCPFTQARAGRMQYVCVEAATRVRISKRR